MSDGFRGVKQPANYATINLSNVFFKQNEKNNIIQAVKTLRKVLVVGSYVVDLMSRTPHMPSPGETVLGGPFQMGPGGKGGNQAVAAARLGYQVTMLTKVGNDTFGDEAFTNFKNEKIDASYVSRHPEEATGTALIAVDEQSENMIIVAPGACGKITKEDVLQARKAFEEADIILTQLETSQEAVETTIELAHELGKPLVLNPAPFQPVSTDLLKKVTYITPNETEARLLTGIHVVDEDTARQAAKVLIEMGVDHVVITLGKAGCFLFDGTDEGVLIPSIKVDVADTTGAGDAFNGALASFVADEYRLKEAAIRANAAAALAVTKWGTAPAMPYHHELKAFLGEG